MHVNRGGPAVASPQAPAAELLVREIGSLGGIARMATREQLREIERTVGFSYPSSFVSAFEEFSSLVNAESFRRAFPDSRLLLSAPEIAAARESTPPRLFPFMREESLSWPDIYAFD